MVMVDREEEREVGDPERTGGGIGCGCELSCQGGDERLVDETRVHPA